MTFEEIITILGLILIIILFYFSLKMGFEYLIKNYSKEIKIYYEQNGYSIIKIRKPLKNEKVKNPFLKTIRLSPFMISPLIIYKYRIVETKNENGVNRKNWVEIKICYLRKPNLKYE